MLNDIFSAASANFANQFAGNLASSLFGGGGDSHSKIFKRQQAWTRYYDLEGPAWKMHGLRNAGLNPILAAQNGFNTGTQQAGGSSGVSTKAEITTAKAAQAVAAAQTRNLKADTKLKESQTSKTEAETLKVDAERWNIIEDTHLKTELKMQARVNINKIKNEAIKIAEETNVAIASVDEIRKRIQVAHSQLKINDQQLQEMFARFPGLLVQKEISKTMYYKIMKYVEVALPTVNSASGLIGALGIATNAKKFLKSNDVDLRTPKLGKGGKPIWQKQ
jgi:hypothetical protein